MIRERPLADLTDFRRDLLIAVSLEDGEDGQTIKRVAEQIRAEDVHHERLYNNLDELAEDGLIHKHRNPATGNEYLLSEHGETVLHRDLDWQYEVLRE